MALMRTSRKATTGPGDPKKNTGIKPKVTTTPETTVTGQRKFTPGATTAEAQWKEHSTVPNYEYYPGLGKKTKHQKLKDDQMKSFRERDREMGVKLLAKEVRWDPTNKAKPLDEAGRPTRYQVDYYNPTTEKAAYETESRRRYAEEGSPVMKTRKAQQLPQTKATLISPKKKTEMVSKAIQAPAGKTKSFKKQGSVTDRLKSKGALAGGAEGRKFRKEEKLAGSYERTKALVSDREGMGLSPKNKNKQAMLKDFTGELKSARKSATDKRTKTNLTGAIKDIRKSQKFEKKEMAGKTKYFNKSKMADTVEKKPSSKGVYQAGKLRYK
jgi:hypothetical protein